MHHPYWADEAWVAALSKAPLSQWIGLSSSTPIGFLLAVRLFPSGRDGLRLVPLLFAAGYVVMAYVVARCLPWKATWQARFAGSVAAVVVLLAPISLIRNDLKQYTADAFFALVIIALALRADGKPTPRTLAELGVGSLVALLFSTTAAFVAVAVFTGLVISALISKSLPRIRDTVIAGGIVALGLVIYLATIIIPQDNKALRAYWRSYYLRGGWFHELHVAWQRLARFKLALGMPAPLFVALAVLGIIVLVAFKRPAVAIAVPALWMEMILAGRLDTYPFLDQRTSTFLMIVSLTVAAIGVVGLIVSLASRSRLLALVLAVMLAAVFVHRTEPFIRARTIANEDVRSQILYIAQHQRPGDVVVVSLMSQYGVSYYWPGGAPRYFADNTGRFTNGFSTRLAHQPNMVYASWRDLPRTKDALQRALMLAKASSGPVHIWIIRTHVNRGEAAAWKKALADAGVSARAIPVGPEPLLVVDSASS
jgi:hypothetical protein